MNTKTITRRGREWLWPEYDTKLLEAFDDVDNIDTILEYCPNRRVAIQAGGACGVWPCYLAVWFELVMTFEPDPINYKCLMQNSDWAKLPKNHNIYWDRIALGKDIGWGALSRHEREKENAGAGYVCQGREFRIQSIDAYFLSHPFRGPVSKHWYQVDLICLDVEGDEWDVIKGAQHTIRKNYPTIVIEEKPLPQGGDPLAARRLLESWGYVERAKVGNDVIFTHKGAIAT